MSRQHPVEPPDDKGPIAFMAWNSVAANLLMALLLVGGVVVGSQVKQEVFPEFEQDIVTVVVAYPGASPAEVEEGIVAAIEEEVSGLDGIKKVTSRSSEGLGTVYVELLLGEDKGKLLNDVKASVDRITSFPEDAERPIVSLMSNKRRVISVAVYGEQDERVLKEFAERFRDRLLGDDRITQVELEELRPVEISIEVPQARLREHGLTLDGIAQAVGRTAVQIPAGNVKTDAGEVLLRTDERRDRGREFRDVPIVSTPSGGEVTLGDLARIDDGFAEIDRYSTFDGKPAVMLDVFRVGDETPVSVADAVREEIEAFEVALPAGVRLGVTSDDSEMFRDRMDLLLRNAALGLVLVLVILGLFLRLELALWVTLGIPISFLGALLFLPAQDVSINMISLFAFIVTLGIVVDDAIVVGENIYEYRQRGMGLMDAAIKGTREVAMPVTFSVLTTVAAFMPLFFVPGFIGKLFGVIPAVVVTVLLMSLVESLFVLPAHLGHRFRLPRRGLGTVIYVLFAVPILLLRPLLAGFDLLRRAFSGGLAWLTDHVYTPLLRWGVTYRYLTLGVGVASLLVVVGFIRGGHIGFSFLPRIESDRILATAVLPVGTPASTTEAVKKRLLAGLDEAAHDLDGPEALFRSVYATLGSAMTAGGPGGPGAASSGSHVTSVQVRLTRAEERETTASAIVEAWRKRVGEIPGVETLTFRANIGPSAGSPIEVQLSHRDVPTLERAAADLARKLADYAGVFDIDDGFTAGKPQLDFQLTPVGVAAGLTAADLARQVRGAFYGAEALRQQRGRDEVRVFVRLPDEERTSEHDIASLMIRTPDGGEMPLYLAADTRRGRADTTIVRSEGRRVVSVTADLDPAVTNANKVLESLRGGYLGELQEAYPGLSWSLEGEQREQAESLGSLGEGFRLALLVIFGMLAVVFRSYIQPIVVMLAIPFGIVGAVLGHLLMGFELSMMSMMGIVALSGVVVNDSLVLVHAANGFRDEQGMKVMDAVIAAGRRRLRPILLTSLTTFFGLMPMILEKSVQARFLVPMAVSLGFGVIFSTFIILGLVPAFYLMVEDVRHLFGFHRRALADVDPDELPPEEPEAQPATP